MGFFISSQDVEYSSLYITADFGMNVPQFVHDKNAVENTNKLNNKCTISR